MSVRLDHRIIEEHIPRGARVLDLGCGDGSLLEQLIRDRNVQGWGIDNDLDEVQKCIGRGVPVYHGDLLEGMAAFEDGRFDCVILSQTLQQTPRPDLVVREMLRVGRRAVISFPNFGHWRVRLGLLFRGRMPVTPSLPYQWYDTPNIHLMTVRDFFDLCRSQDFAVVEGIFLGPHERRLTPILPNLRAAVAIFVVESGPKGGGRGDAH